jgi:adhesin transport system outer membrane protein
LQPLTLITWLFRIALSLVVALPAAGGPVLAEGSLAIPRLPPPSTEPLNIDFARDPFLNFVRTASPPDTFRATIGAAVEVHPAVAAAAQSTLEARAVKTEVRAGLMPKIDAELIAGRSLARNLSGDKVFVERLSPTQRSDAIANADQLIFDFGATSSRVNAASARIKAAQAEVARVATDTALRSVAAYYDVLTFQTLIEINAATVTRFRQILSDTRARFTQGLGSGGDVARAQAFLADAQVNGVKFQRRLDEARGNYRELFGADAPLHLARPVPPKTDAHSFDEALARSHDAPAVSAASAQTAAARDDWRATKGDALPRLSAGVTGSLYDIAGGANNYDVRGQLLLRQTFTVGGASSARIAQAKARYEREQFTTTRIADETARDAGVAWQNIALLEQSTATLIDAYEANRRARDMFVEQFRVSRGTQLDLLRAEQDYSTSAANYLQGAVELDVARYVLLARTGELLPVFGIAITSREAGR